MNLENGENELASRWVRLFAYIIDMIIIQLIAFLFTYLLYGKSYIGALYFQMEENGIDTYSELNIFLLGFLGVVLFVILNIKLLFSRGQTIGKYILKIKIVNEYYELPNKTTLVIRYLVYFISIIPFIGGIFSLIDSIFIFFNKQKQCLHDLAAKTYVVKYQ